MIRKFWIRTGLVFFAFFACSIPFFKVLFFEDRALLYRDISRHFLPGKVYWARSVLEDGSIPLWNYSSFGGMPFWAENVNSPLHPLNFLFLLFPIDNAPNVMNWFIYLHYPAILLGAYSLLRLHQWKRAEAFLMGYALAISGTLMSAHNLCHSLFSFVAVPWFFSFWISYLKFRRISYLFAASAALAWPIYAGDPQFSYLLTFAALFSGLRYSNLKPLMASLFALGCLSLACSAAQLLPLAEMILQSSRASVGLSRSELLYFSFHPIRFLESIYPQIFGNHIGDFSFWGQKYVNFPFPSPFVFSTFPGSLTLILGTLGSILSVLQWKKFSGCSLVAVFLVLSFLCFGAYSPIPIYEMFLDWLPLFQSFRYPERLLLFLNFIFWLIACNCLSQWRNLNDEKTQKKIRWCLAGIAACYVTTGLVLYFNEWAPRINRVTYFSFVLTLITFVLIVFVTGKKAKFIHLSLLLPLLLAEAFLVQEKLSWDSSVYITDKKRYTVIKSILSDLKLREPELKKGAARRYTSLEISPRSVSLGALSHTNLSNFAAFEVATPNISSFYGFDDISGYFALSPMKFELLLLSLVGESRDMKQLNRFYDITGTYYRSYRGPDQQIILEKRKTAVPYLFMPPFVEFFEQRDELMARLKANDFSQRALLHGKFQNKDQAEGAEFLNLQRSGAEMSVRIRSKNPNPWIIWNESEHDSWKPYVGSIAVPKLEANGFSMAVQLPEGLSTRVDGMHQWDLMFRFENRWIRLGLIISTLFSLFFLFSFLPLQNLKEKIGKMRYS